MRRLVLSILLLNLTWLNIITPAHSEEAGEPSDANGVSSWEKPQLASAANLAQEAPKSGTVLATGTLTNGATIEITQLKRTSGETVTLKFTLKNQTSAVTQLDQFGGEPYAWHLGEIHLLDLPNKKKYFVLTDSEKHFISSKGGSEGHVKPGAQISLWAKFPAPPLAVAKISIEIPNAEPFEDLPIAVG